MSNAIEISNLNKQYKMFPTKTARLWESMIPWYTNHKVFTAVNDLNLTVKKGEILGILGANGAGKSTLLKIITGVIAPTSGNVSVDGVISSLLELGTGFNLDLTGIENIYQHGQISGLDNETIKKRLPEIIEFADIGDHLYQPVKTYSSGMFARLAFACAINIDPEILIVDEVLSVGDINFQMKCYKKFEEFKKQGKTILFVSHSMADILKNCTRAIIMKNGSIIEDGDTKHVVDQYKKLMVGIDIENETIETTSLEHSSDQSVKAHVETVDLSDEQWSSNFTLNDNPVVYGNGMASIIDYGIFDASGNYAYNVDNSKEYSVKMKVKFNQDIYDPIFAISIKDIKGLELCGVNTFVYPCDSDKSFYEKDEIVTISFTQTLPLQPGNYSLSFGCTRYASDGTLEVFERLYDVILFDVIAIRPSLGLLDLKSTIEIN